MSENCFYCDAEATLLCDGNLGFLSLDGKVTADVNWAIRREVEFEATCDRPLCATHAVLSRPVFFDGTDKNGKRFGWSESRDFCAGCVREGRDRPQAPTLLSVVEMVAAKLNRLQPL